MRKIRRVSIRTTQEQRETLELLRKRMAELGCFIFSVAPWYRRHKLDFVAVPKALPAKLVVVRPTKNGNISVRPFCQPSLYAKFFDDVKIERYSAPVCFSKRQLPYSRRDDWWHAFLPIRSFEEYRLLAG